MKLSLQSFLRQMINVPAILRIQQVIQQPNLLVPHISVNNINDINIELLKAKYNVKYIVFDKDNTLSIPYKNEIDKSLYEKVEEFKAAFDGIAILSNSVGSNDDIGFAGAIETEKALGIEVIRHTHKKPGCIDEVIKHFSNNNGKSVKAREICMIGDRVLTDIVFANSYGMFSILVAPLNSFVDHPVAIVFRTVEWLALLPLIKGCGYNAPNHEK